MATNVPSPKRSPSKLCESLEHDVRYAAAQMLSVLATLHSIERGDKTPNSEPPQLLAARACGEMLDCVERLDRLLTEPVRRALRAANEDRPVDLGGQSSASLTEGCHQLGANLLWRILIDLVPVRALTGVARPRTAAVLRKCIAGTDWRSLLDDPVSWGRALTTLTKMLAEFVPGRLLVGVEAEIQHATAQIGERIDRAEIVHDPSLNASEGRILLALLRAHPVNRTAAELVESGEISRKAVDVCVPHLQEEGLVTKTRSGTQGLALTPIGVQLARHIESLDIFASD